MYAWQHETTKLVVLTTAHYLLPEFLHDTFKSYVIILKLIRF